MKWRGSLIRKNVVMYSSNWVLPLYCVGPSRIRPGFHFTGVSLGCLAAQVEEKAGRRAHLPLTCALLLKVKMDFKCSCTGRKEKKRRGKRKVDFLRPCAGWADRTVIAFKEVWGALKPGSSSLHMFPGLSRLMVRFLAMFWLTPTHSCLDFSRTNNS